MTSPHTASASEPAFPTESVVRNSHGDIVERTPITGLTKREWLIGMAMQGLCAQGIPGAHNMPENIAREAVRVADEVLTLLSDEEQSHAAK